MDLKDIAAISGKSGLYKVVKPTRTGLILEALDESKTKLIAGASNRVSLLNEISVFTTGEKVSTSLEKVLMGIHKKYGSAIPIDSKASNEQLFSFLSETLPDFDREKVYPSDIKKLVGWYGLLSKYAPEKFKEEEVKEATAEDKKAGAKKEEVKAEAKKEATSEKKTAKKEETEAKSAPKTEKPKAKKETTEATEQKEPAKKSGTKK